MADKDAKAIIRAAQTTTECEEQRKNILAEVKIIRRSLWNLRADVKEFQVKCNIVKTVGTGAIVAGAGLAIAGYVGAFFTGGVSLLLNVGALAATGTGVAVNVTTNVIDRKETQEYIDTINNKVYDLQNRLFQLECILAQHETAVKWFMNSHGLNEDEAISFLTNFVKENQIKISGNLTVLGKGAATFKAARDLSQTIKTMKSIGTFTKSATGSMSFTITKTGQLTKIEKKVVRDYAPIAFGRVSVLGKIFQVRAIVLYFAFIVGPDIVSLVKGWTNNPAVEVIDVVLCKLDAIEKHFNDE